MAITTHAELLTAINSWLNVSSSDWATNQATDLVMAAERRIFREVRVRSMEVVLSTTLGSGVLAVPSDYVEMKTLQVTGTPYQSLQRKPVEWIYAQYNTRAAAGKPKFFAREASNFIFGPYPDSDYGVHGVYYKRLNYLATTINALFTDCPDLYLFGALAESEPILGRDSRIAIWEAKYQKILGTVNGEDQREGGSGSQLTMAPG